jgi:hypothetical protein
MLEILQDTRGKLIFGHDTGEQSYVTMEIGGMGTREIRIATLPPEIHDCVIKETRSKYGEVTEIKEDNGQKLTVIKSLMG